MPKMPKMPHGKGAHGKGIHGSGSEE